VPVWRLRIVKRIEQAGALYRMLLDAMQRARRLAADDVEHRRQQIDNVAVLRAHLALSLDALCPMHDDRITRTAFAVRFALPGTERRVRRLRPADRVVRIELARAEFVEFL